MARLRVQGRPRALHRRRRAFPLDGCPPARPLTTGLWWTHNVCGHALCVYAKPEERMARKAQARTFGPRLVAYVRADRKRATEKAAEQMGVSVSTLITLALRDYLDRRKA